MPHGRRANAPRACSGWRETPAQRLDAVGWSTAALDIRLLTARIATDLGRLGLATAQLQAAARARRSAQLEQRARAWHALALLRVQTGDRRGAYAAVSAGLAAAERQRALLGATELRVLVAAQVAELAALGVDTGHRGRGIAERVLCSAERYRAATLRIRPVLPPPDESLAELRAALRVAADEAEKARLGGAPVQALSRRQHALEDQLRQRLRHSPGGLSRRGAPAGGLSPGRSAGAAQAADRPALAGRVLIEYVESAGDLYAVIIGAGHPALRIARPGRHRSGGT